MLSWAGWSELDGGYAGGVEAVGSDADGRLEIFGLAPATGGAQVMHNWQTAPNGGWNGWASLGSPPQNDVLSHVEVAPNADGRLEVFLRYGAMSVGDIWTIFQTSPNNGWSSWANLQVGVGHVTTSQVLASNADGRLELFAMGSPEGVTHAWQTAPNGGWSSNDDLGQPAGVFLFDVAVGRNADGRLAVFSSGNDGAIWHIEQTAVNNGWGSWSSLGTPPGDSVRGPVVGANADGRLEVFAGGGLGVWTIFQTSPGGPWSSWANMGYPSMVTGFFGLAVISNADGRLELFGADPAGDVWHIWQTAPNGSWSGWDSLGGEPADVLVAGNQDGRLEVFVNGRAPGPPPPSGGVWHRWQTTPGGAWST